MTTTAPATSTALPADVRSRAAMTIYSDLISFSPVPATPDYMGITRTVRHAGRNIIIVYTLCETSYCYYYYYYRRTLVVGVSARFSRKKFPYLGFIPRIDYSPFSYAATPIAFVEFECSNVSVASRFNEIYPVHRRSLEFHTYRYIYVYVYTFYSKCPLLRQNANIHTV